VKNLDKEMELYDHRPSGRRALEVVVVEMFREARNLDDSVSSRGQVINIIIYSVHYAQIIMPAPIPTSTTINFQDDQYYK
jgi:hypothetical protein